MSFIGNMFNSGDGAGFKGGDSRVDQGVSLQDAGYANQQALKGLLYQDQGAQQLANMHVDSNIAGTYEQQQQLANQLQQQALGQGPNPAMAQLAQATQANTANQAALMAGQRGAGQNAGLIARQAAMQGGANQQQMVGQGATMQAQQQLAAQQALAQQQAQMQGQNVGMLGMENAQRNAYSQGAQGYQSNVLNGLSQANNARAGIQSNMNNVNAGMAQTNVNAQAGMLKGMGSAAMMLAAHGGQVPMPIQNYAMGGSVGGPSSILGQSLMGSWQRADMPLGSIDINNGANLMNSSVQDMSPVKGDKKEKGISSIPGQKMAGGPMDSMGMSSSPMTMVAARGGSAPGQALVPGDSPQNDIVPAKLSPGEIVIPRSITQGKDAGKKAKAFVEAILAKQGMRK